MRKHCSMHAKASNTLVIGENEVDGISVRYAQEAAMTEQPGSWNNGMHMLRLLPPLGCHRVIYHDAQQKSVKYFRGSIRSDRRE
jgi:hypothetical protein